MCQVETYFTDCAKIIKNFSDSQGYEKREFEDENFNVEKVSLNCWKVVVILTQTLCLVVYIAHSWKLTGLLEAMSLSDKYPFSKLLSSSVLCATTVALASIVLYF